MPQLSRLDALRCTQYVTALYFWWVHLESILRWELSHLEPLNELKLTSHIESVMGVSVWWMKGPSDTQSFVIDGTHTLRFMGLQGLGLGIFRRKIHQVERLVKEEVTLAPRASSDSFSSNLPRHFVRIPQCCSEGPQKSFGQHRGSMRQWQSRILPSRGTWVV